jgi:hypothetical protein
MLSRQIVFDILVSGGMGYNPMVVTMPTHLTTLVTKIQKIGSKWGMYW